MPTRLVSQNINVSTSISHLTPLEEVVFIHLIVSVDDYGRFHGNPDILKGMLFPIRNDISVKQISAAIKKLEDEGMIRRYRVKDTDYLELTSWMNYQKPRAKSSRFPGSEDADGLEQIPEDANKCKQVKTDEVTDDSPILYRLPLNTGEEHGVSENQIKEYAELYPGVDVEQEIRAMIGWLKADRKRLKTKAGIRRFIAGWLNRCQDRGPKKAVSTKTISETIMNGDNPFR